MPKTCPVCSTTYPDSDAFCPKDGTTLRTDEAANTLVGSVIADRYLVSKLLGEGGMGQVYLAGHVRLPQQAAIKVLHASMVKDPGAVARFNREAANAARIEHERVARVFDFGETSNGLVYLAMEFVPGRTLREVLDDAGRLPPSRAANIVYQVAEGLDAAHRISIVHRDLKPDNILVVTDDQGTDRCKVVDFGIAKAFDDSDNRKTQLTQAGAIIGTPEFMSPEQVLGEQLDARSDVYALAVVAYHLFTGALPFSASTPERSLTARLISDPLPLRESAPDVEWPDALQVAFDRAMSREPETRTASALEFAEEMVAATEGWTGAVVLRGRTPMSTAALSSPRTVSGSVPTVASSVPTGVQPSPAPAATPNVSSGAYAAAGPARSRLPMMVGAAVVIVAVAIGGYALSGRDDAAPDPVAAPDSAPSLALADTSSERTPGPPAVSQPTASTQSPAAAPAAAPQNAPQAGSQGGGRTSDAAAVVPVVPTPPAPETTSLPVAGAEPPSVLEARDRLAQTMRRLNAAEDQAFVTEARRAIPELQAMLRQFRTAKDSAEVFILLAPTYGAVGDMPQACIALKYARRVAAPGLQQQQINALAASEAFSVCPP